MEYLITTEADNKIRLTTPRHQPGRLRSAFRRHFLCFGCRGKRHRSAFPGCHRR